MSYYLDHDGHGDMTLWRNDPGQPYPVAVRWHYTAEAWSLLLRGAGLHDCQPGTQQVCNTCLGVPSVPHIAPDEECWCDLGIKDVCDACQYGPTRTQEATR